MGIFGSSTKTTVGTSVSRVIPNDQLPDALLEGMTRYLTSDEDDGGADGQMMEQVMDSLASSIGVRANRMYNFGKDHYLYGLPSGQVFSSFAGRQASKTVLESLTGGAVTLSYYHFGPLNNMHVAWKKLTEDFGYDYTTNEIVGKRIPVPGQVGIPVYLKDMQLVVTEATLDEASNGSLDQWGTPPNSGTTPEKKYMNVVAGTQQGATPFAVDPQALVDHVIVTVCWEVQEPVSPSSTLTHPVVKFDTFTIALTGYDFTADWHQAKYVDHNNHTGYWVYRHGSGDVSLDSIYDVAYADTGHFFPWVYLRYAKTPQNQDKASQGYMDTKRIMKMVNMDADHIIDSVHQNPDINDVEQAMMVMAVPADTSNPIEQRYLFDFFSGLYEQSKEDASQYTNTATNTADYGIMGKLLAGGPGLNKSSIVIQDKRFKMALNWRNIVKRRVAGSIGPKGTYAGGANSVPSSVSVPSLGGGNVTWDTTSKRHWYQHQLTKDVYEEVQIFELKLTYHIFEQYTTTGDESDEILLIPVDMSLASGYTITEREVLYSRALHYVFNSRVVTKLKWYQTGLFRDIMLAVAIVVTVMSIGSAWETIALAMATTVTLNVVLLVMLQQAIKYLLLKIAFKLFVRAFGEKVAFIVAVVAAITATYMAIDAGGLDGAPWASDLLSVSTGLTKAIGTDLQNDFQDLLGQQTEFERYIKEQTKTLEAKQDLLNHNEFLAPLVVFGESPHDFFQRTVHSGNIGAIGMDAITSFVDVALTLPTISDTLA